MSIYVLALCFVPCADQHDDAVPVTSMYSTLSIDSNAASSISDDHIDLCSPLCVCACCSVLFQSGSPVLLDNHTADEHPSFVVHYLSPFSASDLLSVWQPPKFA